MIRLDERGDRWLLCDCCPEGNCARFWGIGLETAKQVRQAARDLEGWRRRKIIVCMEPLEMRSVDLCRGCDQPEVQVMRFVKLAPAAGS